MARIWMAMAALGLWVASVGCNGLMVVERGPQAGELNWFGRAFVWTGDQTDKIGITEEVVAESETSE